MNIVQKKLYDLLIEFDALCKKFGIIYYLGGGSALGALRHKGFLPWDDDVDLYMTRKNYEKLLSVQDDFFSDEFILVNNENYPNYGNTLVRCTETKSTAITRARIADGTPKGQFLEIFILDPMPIDKQEQILWKKKQWVYTELISFTFRTANDRVVADVDKELYNHYLKLYKEYGRDKVLKDLEKELFTIEESEAVEYCARWGLRKLIYNIEWFQEPRYVPFEDIELPVATCAENVLRFDYGDNWMYIPKVENQIVHSFADSMTIGYKNIVDDYTQFVNVQEIFDLYKEQKVLLMEKFFSREKLYTIRMPLKSAQVISSVLYNLPSRDELYNLLKNKSFDHIREVFKVWYKHQFHKYFWIRNTLIDLGDDLLFYALIPLLYDGDYSKIRKVLLMKQNKNKLNSELEMLLEFVNILREIYIALDNHDIKTAKKLMSLCMKKDYNSEVLNYNFKENSLDYKKLKLYIDGQTNDKKVLMKLKKEGFAVVNEYSKNGEILSHYADICYKLDSLKEAYQYYDLAKDRTQHGFIKLHIEERLCELMEGEIANDRSSE